MQTQYIVLEIQHTANGVATLTNTFADRATAEQKYHLVLSAAAVSAVPIHTALMVTSDGALLACQTYRHDSNE